MNRFILAALLSLVPAAAPCPERVQADRKDDEIMKQKLDHAQRVFCALAKNELETAASNASSLAALTRDARWRRSETPEYMSRSVEFERTATTLADMANTKNSEGAALAWVQLTAQCLDCHRWLREGKKPRATR
jgi:hypothetical protein